jgi:ArsR family transcriptional regulator
MAEDLVVADLGCGTGDMLVQLAGTAARVIGVDREPAMLEIAGERTAGLANVELRLGGLERLPLRDAEVDASLCMLVLHHVEDLDAALREMRRAVSRRGRVVVVDMASHEREEYRRTMGHVHLGFAERELRARCAAAGLSIASWRPIAPASDAQGPPLFVSVLRPA